MAAFFSFFFIRIMHRYKNKGYKMRIYSICVFLFFLQADGWKGKERLREYKMCQNLGGGMDQKKKRRSNPAAFQA